MSGIGWFALAFLICWSVWVVARFREEGARINRILADFDRDHPVREPGKGDWL